MKKAVLVVAAAFLLYAVYQAVNSTIFIFHFPAIIDQIPTLVPSSQPQLQLALIVSQEVLAGVGSVLRLVGAGFALSAALLFFRNDPRYLRRLGNALLFEALYFLLLLPAGLNHIVGSAVSTSQFLNTYTGASFMLQAVLVFPPVLLLSRKLKQPQQVSAVLKWTCIVAPLYVFALWVRQGFMWLYALSPLETQQAGVMGAVGAVNSWVTLLVATAVTIIAVVVFWQKKKLNRRLVGTALILVGAYFVVYALVAVWVPVYMAFLPFTDFWMVTLPILGADVLIQKDATGFDSNCV